MRTMAAYEQRYRLPGEPTERALPDEIEHWRLVYGELVTFLDELLDRSALTSTSPQARVLRSRREEFARGLQYWSDQDPYLEALVNPSDTGNEPDRPLDGKDPTTQSHAVVMRWVRAYSDLIRAKESLLADLVASRARSAPEASLELDGEGDHLLLETMPRRTSA